MTQPRVLYIASSSVTDPLVVSQVIRYLRQMRDVFEVCFLLTLERQKIGEEKQQKIAAELRAAKIQWLPLEAYGRLRALNVWREIAGGYRVARDLIKRHRLNLIHARSFIPGNIGLRASRTTGSKLLYDMRGFWAEEKWAKGTIRRPWMRRVAQRMENRLFDRADALVSLTHAGRQKLVEGGIRTAIEVIPCCVDTQLFHWNGVPRSEIGRVISVGSLGRGYLPEAIFGVFAAVQDRYPAASLQLLTRADDETIRRRAADAGCDMGRIEVAAVDPAEVPGYLHQADLALCMIQPSAAKIASSPTKLAEYFACGLPVIANCDGIGDMTGIVVGNRVGVNLESIDAAGYAKAVDNAGELMSDPDLSSRCRELAERDFSTSAGAEMYASIYERLVAN